MVFQWQNRAAFVTWWAFMLLTNNSDLWYYNKEALLWDFFFKGEKKDYILRNNAVYKSQKAWRWTQQAGKRCSVSVAGRKCRWAAVITSCTCSGVKNRVVPESLNKQYMWGLKEMDDEKNKGRKKLSGSILLRLDREHGCHPGCLENIQEMT